MFAGYNEPLSPNLSEDKSSGSEYNPSTDCESESSIKKSLPKKQNISILQDITVSKNSIINSDMRNTIQAKIYPSSPREGGSSYSRKESPQRKYEQDNPGNGNTFLLNKYFESTKNIQIKNDNKVKEVFSYDNNQRNYENPLENNEKLKEISKSSMIFSDIEEGRDQTEIDNPENEDNRLVNKHMETTKTTEINNGVDRKNYSKNGECSLVNNHRKKKRSIRSRKVLKNLRGK